jgi:hypothetical protein
MCGSEMNIRPHVPTESAALPANGENAGES